MASSKKDVLIEQAKLLEIETKGLTIPQLEKAIAEKKAEDSQEPKEEAKVEESQETKEVITNGMEEKPKQEETKTQEESGEEHKVEEPEDESNVEQETDDKDDLQEPKEEELEDESKLVEDDSQEDSKESVSIYAQHKLSTIRYIGENERVFKESLKRPFPILNNGDICVVDIKTANFLTRPTGGFEKIDLKEIAVY